MASRVLRKPRPSFMQPGKLGRSCKSCPNCRLDPAGTKYGEPGLTDALPDTSNLRVWDAREAPVGQPLYRGLLCCAKGARRSGPKKSPSQNPKEEMSGVRQCQHFNALRSARPCEGSCRRGRP